MTTRKKTQKSTQQALNTGAQMFGKQPYTTVEDVKGTPNMVEQSMPPPTKAWTPTNWKQWDEEQQENQYQSEFERGRRYDTENKPIDTNLQTPLYQMSQQEQISRASESSKKIFSDMEVGTTVSDLIKKGEKDAAAAAREVQSKTSPYVDDNGFSAFATLRAANEARTPSKLVKDFQNGLQDKMEYLVYSHSKEIEDGAKDARMDVPTYIDKYVVPQYLSQIETSLRDEVRKGYMPKSDFEYIMSGVKDWVPGMLVRIATQTGEQYALEDEAKQQYGDKASWGVKALNEGMAFVDPTFAGAFGAGRVAGKTIQSAVTSGVNRAVQTKIGQKLAPVAVQKAADYATKFGTGAQATMAKLIGQSGSSRVGSFLTTYSKELPAEIIGQSLGMNLYGSLSGGVSTYGQTRDIYEAGKVAWEGLTSKEGVASGTAFAIGMPILHNLYGLSGLGWKAGDSLLKKTVMGGAKLAYEGASVLGTAGVMTAGHNLGYFLNGEDMDWTLNTFMEQTTTAAAMKYNPNLLKRLSQWPKMLKNMGSKETNNPLPFRLEKEEVDMILDLTHTETLSDALYTIFPDLGKASGKLRDVDARVTEARKNYLRLMNQLPWDTANKINMLTGSMTIARPRAASYEYNGKKLMEIGEDGSILSVKEVTSREQAEAYIAEKKIAQNNADLVKSWFDAYRNNKDEMDRRVDAFEQEHNLKPGTLYSILLSDPMSRIGTNRELLLEQAAMQMEDLFRPRGKAHVDQSRIEGENVANDADILGATPNVEAIRALDAEVDREQANFESALARAPWRKEYQSLKGKGMSDADALATLSDKYKEADLAPLADFVNAQAKQEGFLSAVGHSVDSKVSERVNTLTYRMDDKGEKVQHDDVIELVDADGNIVHLVGGVSGKTSVVNGKEYLDGDLMVIVDATGETHAVKTSDYSINRRLAKSDYDAEYREALGVKATQIIDPTEKLNPERIKQESLKKESAKEESAKEPLKTEEPAKEELAEEPVMEEPVKEERPAEEEPRDERGDLDFVNERVTPDRAVEEIYDRNGLTEAEAGDFVAEKKAEAEKLYTEASNEPVTRNTGEGLSEFAQRKAEYNAKVEGLKRNLEKWNQIETAAERRNMTKTGAELTAMDLDARERDIKRQTEERVDELAKKLGDVEKVYDISEVTNPDALAELRAGRTVYGWYDRKKDKVVLYMPNVTNPRAATRTIIHEQVIHRGLSKMFKDYDNVLAEIYDKVMTPSEQKEFYEYVNGPKKGKEEDIRKKQLEAADEWIANNHESLRFKQYNVWSNLISSVRGILRKNGFDVDYTRRDIENLVRDSYRNLEKSGAKKAPDASAGEGTMLMGSRVNKRMKEVGDIFADRELSDAERSVVDVYSGKADNKPITVTTADGQERRVVMRQGNESGAGTKHSLFRHYDTNSGPITAEDILRIPQVIAEGERKEEGRKVVYTLEDNGVRYKVLTEKRDRREEFANFYTNRSGDARSSNTLFSARADSKTASADKITSTSSSDQKTEQDLTNVSENETRFSKSNENQRIFVSNAEKAVEGIKQEKGTPEQWLKMIEKGGGLKAGEDKWMGLSDWLKEHKGKSITKQEVLDFIRENQIQIEEVKYGEANSNPAFASLKEEYDQWLREEGSDYAWKQLTDRYGDDAEIAFWDLGGELAISNEEAAAALLGENVINSTRLDYTTEGLDNKREIALTVPTIESWNERDDIHFGDAGNGRAVAWVRFGETYSYPVIEDVQKVTEFHDPYKNFNQMDVYKPVGSFKSGDYVVHGKGRDGNMIYVAYINDKQLPVAHATLEEARNALNEYYKEHPRKLRKAQRVLVIDEIQSKRHQEGREKGYKSQADRTPAKMEDLIFGEFNGLTTATYKGERLYFSKSKSKEEILDMINERISEGQLGSANNLIPDAPFAKNWHELAMKRMLRLAAEEGYDKIAWTKGEQQAERYNIGESVKNIEVNAVTDAETGEVLENEFDVYTRSNSNGGGFIAEATGRMNTEQIHEIFGKDLGGRIIEGGRTQSNTIIEGDDLRIGGEGMKGFYDKMLPSFMNKYGKKWGTKVGEVELPDVEEAGRTMWSVDVTPEMKESVMEGQTMFSKKMNEVNYETGEEVRFSKREEPDPKKTQKVYKLMRLGEDGKLYPLYIDNASAVELGQWYNADSPNLGDLKKLPSGIHLIDSEGKAISWEDYKAANNLKGKKPNADVIRQTAENGSRWVSIVDKPTSQKRYEGENRSYYNLGINGSGQVGEFAMRPGWHAGSLPTMRQIGKGKNKDLRDDSFVWVEGEVSADKDYQQEAESNPDKDIPTHIPTDGYYLKATNANKKASQADRVGWYVAGAFKPNRIIGDSEARSIIDKWNAVHPSEHVEYDFPREGGKDFEPGDTRFSKAIETELDKAFNEKLSTLNDENKDKIVFDLGRPSKVLLDAGVSDKPMKLYGNKVIKKQKKHGFDLSELKGLPSAIADPIAVFDNNNNDVNRSILTELHTEQGNVLAAVTLGKGMDIDVNIIRSVFGKGEENLFDWLKRGMATYINEKKTLDFLHHSDLLSEALKNQESSSDAAKVNKIGELNKLLGEKLYVRTKNFKDWFGDWEKNPKDAAKTVDENGEPLMLWHETGNDFTVFDPRHEGAGTRDYLTPFGIFLKPSPSPIGVARGGEAKQMALYANIRNPIEFANRKELDDYLRSNCEGYAQAADAIKNIDAEYGKRLDDAERIEDEAMMDIYRNHPEIWNDDAKRMEAYDKYSAESTRILEEWKGAANRQSEALKEITDKFFRNSGHDGIVLKSDEGSFGRKTKTYIAFHPNQVKSAIGNVGTFSRENDDIRFSKKVYGGNSGYVGYSMSKRAAEAREEGRFPKTDFKKEYGVTSKALDALVKAKVISDNEWHHTSMHGNKTTFYEWGEKEYADFYAENKKEIDDMARKGDIEGISAKFEAYDEQLPELRKAEEERIKAERDETLRLQKEYNEYLDDAVDIPSEYTAENGVRIETNGSRKPADWNYFWGDKPAFKNYASKAMEEFEKVVGEKMKDLPSFEEWRKNKFQEQNESVAGTESMRAVDSSGTMFSVRPLLGDKNLHKGLRELKEGEKSHVERVFTENKNFEFSSMNKVESYSDIAYIFRQLEDEAIENSFAVLVKKGKPTVIHLGTGNYTATMVSNSALNVAVNRVNPDKIYFVHNHPSGNLKASRQDEDVLSNLRKLYGPKVADGIIINARSGRYGIYTPSSLHTGADYDVNHGLSDTSNARPIKVYSFSKQVFSPDYQPDALITSSDDVAKFVSSHRLGDRQKLGLIISNSKGAITGNIFLPYSEITNENARDIANDIAYYTSVVGGTRAFMFGNVPLRDVAYKGLSEYVKGFSDLHLLDYVEIDGGRHKSASDEGIRFRFAKTPEEFDATQKEAVEKKGIVMDGLNEAMLNVVNVPRHDFKGSLKDARAEARKWARNMYHGKVFDLPDDGGRYIISNTAIDKYLDATAITNSDNAGIHLAALKELPQIISQSIDAEVHPDYKKGENGVRSEENGVDNDGLLVHRMYGAINIDGETYRVKTTMHEFKDDNTQNTPHSYEVTKIELIESSSVTPYNNGIDRPLNVSTNSISAAKLLNGVEKSYDKGKKLLTESETLTPVNQNAAFRKDYKAEKAQTEDRLLKGNLRETLGKGYTGFVRNLWENKDNPLYKEMHAYVNKEMQKNGFDVNKGVESFLVSKIGSNDRAFWENVRDAYAEGMKKAGNDWKPNLVDVQYDLWLSSKKGNMNDPLFKAEAVAMRDKIAKSLPPVEVVDGAYVDTDTRFRKPVLTPAAQAARDEYDRRVSSQVSRSREAFIDAMESLRVFQEVVGGKDVEDLKNVYVRENLESSIAHVEWEKYQERINKPLSQAVDKIITYMGVGGREGMKQITDYMIQKHGLERNRVMYVRDAIRDMDNPKKVEKMQTDWDTDQAMLRGLLSSGSILFSEYLDMTDTYIRDNVDADYDPNKNDKSGISTYDSNRKLKGKNVEYDESYIRDLVETFEAEIGTSDMENLWDRVREATGFTLDYSYKSGMITAGARDAMKNMFSFYVPLRGYSAETMEEHYGDYLSGGSGKDLNVIKNAEGRKSEAGNPLAYIANMAQGAILSGEKNVTKQHFYRLVEGNDKAPVAISEIWEVKNPQGVWEIATPDLTGARPDEIADIVHTFNEDMRNLQQNGDARIAQYQSAYRFPFEQKAHSEEHIVPVNIGGQRKLIYILADPRVAQALNGKLVNDGAANTFKLGRQALNVMSTFATSYSPEFILSNTSRDTLFANSNIASKENAAYFGKFTKNQAKAAQILSIPNLFSEYYNGTWDKSNYYRRMFAEFMDNGGRTGFIAMSKVEDMKKQLEKELTPNSTGEEVARKVGDFLKVVPGWVEAVNARSENLNRFATYLTSREMGRSEQRSASDAKEVSVNFNRKGAGSATGGVTGAVASYFRNNMMFFNAGMQATELMYRNLSKDKKTAAKTVAFQALVPMAGSAIWAALMTLGDDDKYSQIPHWDRRNNICIPLKDTYIKIPLPVELRAFWGMGDIIAGAIDKKLQTGDNVMYELASQAASVMPLDVMGQNQEQLTKWWHVVEALSPDFVNPVFQANRNMTWNGRPIERDDDFLPAYEKAFANTPTLLVEMSKYAHAKTREGEHTAQDTDLTGWQISPGIVHHFLGSYLTGIYSLTLKTASAGTDIANGEFNVARTPFVSRVLGSYKTGEGSAVIRAKYYKYKKEFDEVAREYNNMANRTNELAMQELLNSARYKRHLVAKGYMGFISKLQELNNQATDPEAKKEISALIDNAMADIVEATDSIE